MRASCGVSRASAAEHRGLWSLRLCLNCVIELASTSSPAIGSSIAARLRESDSSLNHTWVRARYWKASGVRYRGMIDDVAAMRGARQAGALRKIMRVWKASSLAELAVCQLITAGSHMSQIPVCATSSAERPLAGRFRLRANGAPRRGPQCRPGTGGNF